MKMKNLFYICLICLLLSSFFSCDLTQDKEVITEDTETGQIKAIDVRFCPETSFKGTNASGYYNCWKEKADVSAVMGSGTLTFSIKKEYSCIEGYRVRGKIISTGYGSGKFSTPGGDSVIADDSYQWFDYTWKKSGDCTLYGAAGSFGGGVYIKDLQFYWQIVYH